MRTCVSCSVAPNIRRASSCRLRATKEDRVADAHYYAMLPAACGLFHERDVSTLRVCENPLCVH
eukprot:4082995-Pleurochrysis_carterae.AAC.1